MISSELTEEQLVKEIRRVNKNLSRRLTRIEKRGLDKKCNSIKAKITEILEQLEEVNFDYVDNGYFYYKRNASNKNNNTTKVF